MSKDEIYAGAAGQAGPFTFDREVAAVFPDMLRRSIPGYAATIQAIGTLAARHVPPGSHCYDLGCSLGAATLAMRDNIAHPDCRIVAIDNSAAMVERCRRIVAEGDAGGDRGAAAVTVLEGDIRDADISNASLVVMNYTLQFLPLGERAAMLGKVAAGMRDRGVFVLSEKVAEDDETMASLLTDLHHEFKRRNAYSELEISRKRTALENVLIPETVPRHLERLQDAGFRHAGVWLRYFNFVSILASK